MKRKLKRAYIKVCIVLRKWSPPGFKGVGFYDVLRFLIRSLSDAKFTLMAAAMSYNFFFALFPTLILLLMVLPYIPVPDLKERILRDLGEAMPPQSMGLVEPIVNDSFKRFGLGLISLNVFLALRSATKGIIAMIQAFNASQPPARRRNIFQLYGVALSIFFLLFIFLIVSMGVLIAGEIVLNFAQDNFFITSSFDYILLRGFNLLITLLLLLVSISFIYYLAPNDKHPWAFFSPGSIVAGVLMLGILLGLSYFFTNFGNYNRFYGSLGAIIILMLWFYYISMVLLIGFELNCAIDKAHKLNRHFRLQKKEDQTLERS